LDLEIVFQLREVQYTGKVERIINIQVDPEQRVFAERIKLFVKVQVILVF
jgi:hypothetical protein